MGKRALVAAAVVVLIGAGALVALGVVRTYREVSADPCQAEEPRLLETEAVHQQPPTGASPAGPASVRQPCAGEDNSITSGRHSVEYTSTLTDDAIRQHYEAVARDSGWLLKPDPSADQFRLVFGEKWVRDRCLWLSVLRGRGRGRVGEGNAGDYAVEITFWPLHNRSFCHA